MKEKRREQKNSNKKTCLQNTAESDQTESVNNLTSYKFWVWRQEWLQETEDNVENQSINNPLKQCSRTEPLLVGSEASGFLNT